MPIQNAKLKNEAFLQKKHLLYFLINEFNLILDIINKTINYFPI